MKKDKRTRTDRIGEVRYNNQGTPMKIIEYNGAKDIIVEFQDEKRIKVKTDYKTFNKREIFNPWSISVYNVGYIGDTETQYNKKDKRAYNIWHKMISRCYNKKDLHYERYGERGVKVCKKWFCFATFEKWYNENYYELDNEETQLDKDILIKNNKIYSPETCIFVPRRINSLFVKCNSKRGNYPIGVTKRKNLEKYKVCCSVKLEENHRSIHIGDYNTLEEAFQAYKEFKESYIKQVADEYKSKIPQKLYDAMYAYQVEITD